MPLHPKTIEFCSYLRRHPRLRDQVRARPGKALFYSGSQLRSCWRELADLRHTLENMADKETLPDVLARIQTPDLPHPTLLAHVQALDQELPWQPDGFQIWRVLSGLFAANAIGSVSFYVGSGISRETKVFAATEIAVLSRNPHLDPLSRDVLQYYQDCLRDGREDMNFGFISAS